MCRSPPTADVIEEELSAIRQVAISTACMYRMLYSTVSKCDPDLYAYACVRAAVRKVLPRSEAKVITDHLDAHVSYSDRVRAMSAFIANTELMRSEVLPTIRRRQQHGPSARRAAVVHAASVTLPAATSNGPGAAVRAHNPAEMTVPQIRVGQTVGQRRANGGSDGESDGEGDGEGSRDGRGRGRGRADGDDAAVSHPPSFTDRGDPKPPHDSTGSSSSSSGGGGGGGGSQSTGESPHRKQ